MTPRSDARIALILLSLAALEVGGCSSNSGTGGACATTHDCSVRGDVCCNQVCAPVASCAQCTSPADIAGDWHWESICIDTLGSPCPVRTDSTDVSITPTGRMADATLLPGGDNLSGTLCNDEYWWAETGVDGSDNGCWRFNAGNTLFNQRSTADGGTRLCIGVGNKVGTPALPVPDCAAIQALFAGDANAFASCPPAPPGGP